MFEILLLIAVILLIIWLLNKFYFVKYDTIIAYTGGLGSGKSLNGVKTAIKLYNTNLNKVLNHNFKEKIKAKLKKDYEPNILDLPELYSNIPICIKKGVFSKELTADMLLLNERVNPLSVTFIDECSSFINQFEYKNPNCRTLDEFFRLYRHYTGVNGVGAGYLVVTDQNSNMLEIHIRYRVNTVFNLMHFRKWFHFFYTVRVRNISLTEDIKVIEKDNAEDNYKTLFGLLPLRKTYDTYCYNGRYKTVPKKDIKEFKTYKTNRLLKCPIVEVKPKTTNVD